MRAYLAIMLVIATLGCVSAPQKAGDIGQADAPQGAGNPPAMPQEGGTATPPPNEEARPPDDNQVAADIPPEGPDSPTEVLLLGRSVAYGWSEYMGLGWQEDESYLGEYDGKTIRHVQMDYPPDIDDSAIRAVDAYEPDVVFFKLCFVDFGSEYGDMLAEDKGYVENVYQEVVVKRGKKLVVGNALPQVEMHGSDGLRRNHEDYNGWLESFAASHDGIVILDLHGMLSHSGGDLKAGYAVSGDDSHLNDEAYAKITPALMAAIEQAG